jgi:hypothetical protein
MLETDVIDLQIVGCIEDTIDKLHIAGQIMPLTYDMKKNAKQVTQHIKYCSIGRGLTFELISSS